MKRAALYLRVSTIDQHPETQGIELRQFAKQRGYVIVHEYVDHGVSGTKVRRPALDQLLKDANHHKFEAVLVWSSDRLARSTKHFLQVLDDLSELGIQFLSQREAIDTEAHWVERSWSSFLRLPNLSGRSLSSGSAPGCAGQSLRVVVLGGRRLMSTTQRWFGTAYRECR